VKARRVSVLTVPRAKRQRGLSHGFIAGRLDNEEGVVLAHHQIEVFHLRAERPQNLFGGFEPGRSFRDGLSTFCVKRNSMRYVAICTPSWGCR